jgi:hypothetical protein
LVSIETRQRRTSWSVRPIRRQCRDEAALKAHQESDYFKTYIAGQALPLLAKRERAQYALLQARPNIRNALTCLARFVSIIPPR